MLMHPIQEILLKIVCYKLLMKYVERRKIGETMGIPGGGIEEVMEYNKRKWHIKRCAKIDQRKTRLNIRISKIVVGNSMMKEAERELTKLNKNQITFLHF